MQYRANGRVGVGVRVRVRVRVRARVRVRVSVRFRVRVRVSIRGAINDRTARVKAVGPVKPGKGSRPCKAV